MASWLPRRDEIRLTARVLLDRLTALGLGRFFTGKGIVRIERAACHDRSPVRVNTELEASAVPAA
jgi:hypothetical protein